MHAFVAFLLRQRWFVVAATLLLCIAGAVAWTRLPIDAFPDVTNVQVMVLTEAAGLSAADVEQQVTYPIEQQMGGVPRVTQVRSLSKPGLSQVIVVFEDDTDIYFARQQVFERLQGAKEQLPAGSSRSWGRSAPASARSSSTRSRATTLSPMELRGIQDFLVAPQLRPIPGVNEVNSFGGFVKQYHVLVRPDALVKYGLGLRDVVEALERNNANAAGGFIVRGWEQTYVRGLGLLGGVDDIREVVLKVADGTPVYVHDVAEVVVGPQPRQGAVSRDGKGEAVAGMVIMLRGANSKDVVTRVKETVPRIVKSLPPGVALNVFYDRTSLIEACIRTVVDALLEGGILVILVLFLFVAELRTALIVVASLPITFLATFLIMGRPDISSNLMSLGGLAFSVGMVVDASIVIIENIRRHFGERRDPGLRRHVAIEAVSEVARPGGLLGADHRDRDDPALLAPGDRGQDVRAAGGDDDHRHPRLAGGGADHRPRGRRVAAAAGAREGVPRRARRPPRLPRRCSLAPAGRAGRRWRSRPPSLVVAGFAATKVGTEFMPTLDEGAIAINVVRLPTASLDGSVSVSGFMERRLRERSRR